MQSNGGRADNGNRLLSAESISTMHTPAEPGGYAFGWDTDGPAEAPTAHLLLNRRESTQTPMLS